MTIKNKLILSYVLLTVVLTSFWLTYSFLDYNTLVDEMASLSNSSLSKYSREVFNISKNYFEPFSQEYVKLKTKMLAKKVAPVIQQEKNNQAKILADKELQKTFNNLIHIKDDIVVGYSYLINNKNQIIMSPNDNAITATKHNWKKRFPQLYSLLERAKVTGRSNGYYHFYDVDNDGKTSIVGKKYGVIYKIPKTDYYIGTTVFLENYTHFSERQKQYWEDEAMTNIEGKFRKNANTLFVDIIFKSITTVVIVALIFILLGYWIAKTISDPIHRLTNKVKKINSENLNFSIDRNEYGTGETKELSSAFKFLGDELMEYMANLKKEVNERQLIDRDLEIAREIQDHALPKVTPEFCKPEFDIYGNLKPAKKVAGDFYDFYYLNEDKIAVLIGDVSGKGISAAYFMAKIKTLFQAYCLEEKKDPAKVLTKINRILSKDNKSYMFATVFLGYYNIKTGTLVYANAGHHAAIKLKKDGTIKEFGEQRKVVLGFLENSVYESQQESFLKKDILVLYTDGICEATNSSGELYGKIRFFQNCIKYRNKHIKKMLDGVVKDTLIFEGNTPQTDDITVLGLGRML